MTPSTAKSAKGKIRKMVYRCDETAISVKNIYPVVSHNKKNSKAGCGNLHLCRIKQPTQYTTASASTIHPT